MEQLTKYAARAAIGLALSTLASTIAMAGPPFRTDDPEPVGFDNLEFYTFTTGTRVTGDTAGVGPAFEFNYGPTEDIQLHVVAPFAFDSPSGEPNHFGYSDTEVGVNIASSRRTRRAGGQWSKSFLWSSFRRAARTRG